MWTLNWRIRLLACVCRPLGLWLFAYTEDLHTHARGFVIASDADAACDVSRTIAILPSRQDPPTATMRLWWDHAHTAHAERVH